MSILGRKFLRVRTLTMKQIDWNLHIVSQFVLLILDTNDVPLMCSGIRYMCEN